MSENKRFPHGQLDDFLDLEDLMLESFEEAQAEFVNYPEDTEPEFDELDELVDLDDDFEVIDDLEDIDNLDDLETAKDLEPLNIEDFDEFEEIGEDELAELEDIEEMDERDRQKVSEARHALHSISEMLDSLINEDEYQDDPEEVRERCFKPIDTKEVFETLEKKQHREVERKGRSRDYDSRDYRRDRQHRDYEDKREVIDAEFRELEEQTDNLDKILSRSKERSITDQYVSDLYEHRDWDLVIDEEILDKTEALLNTMNNNHDTYIKAQGVEKKSLSTLATALLAGGGVLVFGLATAGVVTAFKSLRKKSKYESSYLSEPMQIKPVTFAKPEPEPEPEPEPVKQKVVEPERVEPLYREMPPQHHRYPPRPFWGVVPPPPPYDDKDVAL